MKTVKVLQARLKDNVDAVTGAWPVLNNCNIKAGANMVFLGVVRFTALPARRDSITWFQTESAAGVETRVSQTMQYVAGASQFTLRRSGSIKINGVTPVADVTKFDLNKWYLVEIYGPVSEATPKINLGAGVGGNGMPSSDWGEKFELFTNGATEQQLVAARKALMDYYGIVN